MNTLPKKTKETPPANKECEFATPLSAAECCLRSILNNMDTVIYVSDLETGKILFANETLSRLYDGKQLVGRFCWEALHSKDARCDFCPIPHVLAAPKECYRWEFYNEALGRYFLIQDRIIPWLDNKFAHLEYAEDITELKNSQKKLEADASTDTLTGALNRSSFVNIANSIFEQAYSDAKPATLVFVDIDQLKTENDTYGHAAGDKLICGVAQVLRANIRESDILGRYGGDEFVIVFNKCNKENAQKRMRKAQKALNDMPGREHRPGMLGFSFGLAESTELPYAESGNYVGRLIDLADKRMFEQKKRRMPC